MTFSIHPSSFRDPSGFIFEVDGEIFRQVNICYKSYYEQLMGSGLYNALVSKGYLNSHSESSIKPFNGAYKIIKPERIPFISYSYEWCFSQLRDAALLTLEIQKISLQYGMSLKDASAYNIQFIGSKPIFIDTLSFENYEDGLPWVAYEQFCRHFLAPLAIMSYNDISLNHLLQVHLDGVPIYIAKAILPLKSVANLGIGIHVFLQNLSAKKIKGDIKYIKKLHKFNRKSMLGMIDNLSSTIEKLSPLNSNSYRWDKYYFQNYNSKYFSEKQKIVLKILDALKPESIIDFGANIGSFSNSIARLETLQVLSIDKDPQCVEWNYNHCKTERKNNVLPLVMDFCAPNPGIGWENKERTGFLERDIPSTIMMLALMHHLVIGNNLTFEKIAAFLFKYFENVIIEFIPFEDMNVQKMIALRHNQMLRYTRSEFCIAFEKFFILRSNYKFTSSEREIFLFIRR